MTDIKQIIPIIQKHLAVATTGPWKTADTMVIVPLNGDTKTVGQEEYLFTRNRREDAQLIVSLRNSIDVILDYIDQLESVVQAA